MATGSSSSAGSAASAGNGRDIGAINSGSGASSYMGSDGQQHQYVGTDANGNPIPDPAYPAATGSSGAVTTSPKGLVASTLPIVGNLRTGTAFLVAAGVLGAVALGVLTVPAGIVALLVALVADAGIGFLSQGIQGIENFFGGDPNEPGISPLEKWARTIAQKLGLGGLMGDFLITATIGGVIYYISRSGGQQIVIRRAGSSSPRPRRIKTVREARRPSLRLKG